MLKIKCKDAKIDNKLMDKAYYKVRLILEKKFIQNSTTNPTDT